MIAGSRGVLDDVPITVSRVITFGRDSGVEYVDDTGVRGMVWNANSTRLVTFNRGLYATRTPALPRPYAVRCMSCECSVSTTHVPESPECESAAEERARSRRS